MRKTFPTPTRGLVSVWRDDRGFILSAELVLILTLGVLAIVVGVHAVAKSINSELIDVGQSFSSMNQSYFVHGFSYYCPRVGFNATTGGSGFIDGSDVCDCAALSFSGRDVAVAGGSRVVGRGHVVTEGPAHVEAPAAIPCPPGSTLEPAPLGAPAVEPQHEAK